jgi:DNA (cytosine-5)-methyltransferase 1
MRSGSLFTGAAGLDRAAAAVFGAELAWVADNDPASGRLLAHHYPDALNHGDITTVDWTTVEPVEVLTAGWPCQPWSQAGKRKGIDDDRALWPEVARAIRTLRPRHVFLENVPAIVAAGELARAVGDLAALGYECGWTVLGANEVGAPHRRNRCFILGRRVAADPAGDGRDEGRPEPAGLVGGSDAAVSGSATAADSASARRPLLVAGDPVDRDSATADGSGQAEPGGQRRVAADADSAGLEGTEPASGFLVPAGRTDWGPYQPAIRRWERVLGRPAPVPTVTGARGGRKLNPALPEWMMGFPAGWITDVPGISVNDALKLAGNAVCEQQATAALRWLLPMIEMESAA